MDINLAKAEYLLALEKNSMTEDIRNNYIESIKDNVNYLKVFASILKTMIKKVRENKIETEEAIDTVKNEFVKLSLMDYLGNTEEFFPFIEFIFEAKNSKNTISIYSLKQYIDIADKINNNSITICIYQAVLNAMLVGEFIGEDIDFSEKVINYIRNYGELNEDDNILLNLITESIMYVK